MRTISSKLTIETYPSKTLFETTASAPDLARRLAWPRGCSENCAYMIRASDEQRRLVSKRALDATQAFHILPKGSHSNPKMLSRGFRPYLYTRKNSWTSLDLRLAKRRFEMLHPLSLRVFAQCFKITATSAVICKTNLCRNPVDALFMCVLHPVHTNSMRIRAATVAWHTCCLCMLAV